MKVEDARKVGKAIHQLVEAAVEAAMASDPDDADDVGGIASSLNLDTANDDLVAALIAVEDAGDFARVIVDSARVTVASDGVGIATVPDVERTPEFPEEAKRDGDLCAVDCPYIGTKDVPSMHGGRAVACRWFGILQPAETDVRTNSEMELQARYRLDDQCKAGNKLPF